ncbi:DUF4167 domain-containing protein [Paracoccus sp. MKU1]|uniref:DUF4167 domain-containing protein n=1 Tax=Paracoccus sp. MKU1 TaxID=1745182 RepID=UPI00071923A2|nr:DUF4167 domain-containing protein [Paracoccus sp. MKU1]KRW93612.1 hypothetical protein AQY21_24130 [Paracoccus sp. MKU1]
MRSSKSRSRNKSNRQRSLGNVVNRVFDSSGPEGKVRGTPQQIIEKYLTLARDAQLSNDRVAEQSFLQHAEHYTRMLGEAQREQAERQSQQHQSRDDDFEAGGQTAAAENGNGHNGHRHHQDRQERRDDRREDRRDERRDDRRDDRKDERQPAPRAEERAAPAEPGLPPVIASDEEAAGPVETPETAATPAEPAATPEASAAIPEEPAAAAEPAPRRRSRSTTAAPRSRKKPAEDGGKAPAAKSSGRGAKAAKTQPESASGE